MFYINYNYIKLFREISISMNTNVSNNNLESYYI